MFSGILLVFIAALIGALIALVRRIQVQKKLLEIKSAHIEALNRQLGDKKSSIARKGSKNLKEILDSIKSSSSKMPPRVSRDGEWPDEIIVDKTKGKIL